MSETLGMTMTILGYNTWLFGNALQDVSAEQAAYCVDERTNKFSRIAGHLVVGRHGFTNLLQIEVPALEWGPFGEPGIGHQFEEERECPPLEDIAAKFGGVTEVLMSRLPEVSEDLLASPSPIPIPGENPTMRDLVAFMTMHETYHIGQLGLLKKSMGGKRIMDG